MYGMKSPYRDPQSNFFIEWTKLLVSRYNPGMQTGEIS
jgi:hypothetical protein